ncbi:MAG: GNAT family N-acetyltransferase [Nocardioidaceae bacterium]
MPSEPGLLVRPGTPADAGAVAELFTAARAAAVPAMPPPVHTPEEDLAWLTEQLDGRMDAWVADEDGAVVGFMLLEGTDWLHSLYVRADRTGQGIGTLLLELAQAQRPAGLQLWVFQSNTGARRLYERHGFLVVEETDGAHNEERAPDLRMLWAGGLEGLRRRIDALDGRLAALLDERARLTAAIQDHKERPGHAGRDPEREAEIVARMAARAPYLGAAHLRPIVDAVITASLDAAGH